MNALMYASMLDGKANDMESVVKELFTPDRLDYFRSIDRLSERLQRTWENESLIVILICSREDLVDLVSMRERLHQFRLVLVLPDAEETTISLAHRLRPNYLAYIYSQPGELKAVLRKMIEKGDVY